MTWMDTKLKHTKINKPVQISPLEISSLDTLPLLIRVCVESCWLLLLVGKSLLVGMVSALGGNSDVELLGVGMIRMSAISSKLSIGGLNCIRPWTRFFDYCSTRLTIWQPHCFSWKYM